MDFERQLARALYRATCPGPQELGEFRLGMLAGREAQVVARHLAECPLCRDEVEQLASFLASMSPEIELGRLERLRAGVRVMVARLAGGGTTGLLPAPAYAGVRGEEAGPAIYTAEDVQIILEITPDPAGPGTWTLLGLVTGLEHSEQGEVTAWREAGRAAAAPCDALGNFLLPGLASGTYDLILSGPTSEVHVCGLAVPPAG